MAAGLRDDFPQQVVGVPAAVGTGGYHRDGGLGESGVKTGESVTEADGLLIVPAAPEDPFDFSRLAGVVTECIDEDGSRCGETGAGLVGELATELDGGGEFGDRVRGVRCFHSTPWLPGFRTSRKGGVRSDNCLYLEKLLENYAF